MIFLYDWVSQNLLIFHLMALKMEVKSDCASLGRVQRISPHGDS